MCQIDTCGVGWTTYGLVNLACFSAFAADKRRAARGLRRIPEPTLLLLAAFGGGLGGLIAQRGLRHKTRKQPFAAWLATILLVQAAALMILLARG